MVYLLLSTVTLKSEYVGEGAVQYDAGEVEGTFHTEP
jgi:hypothetical protein